MSFDFRRALTVLAEHEVEFIVVGGISAILQGAPVVTLDLDVVHRRTPQNAGRLLAALRSIDAGLSYDDLLADTEELRVGPGLSTRILSLRRLVELKTAAGRPKDLAVLPTLRATLLEIEKARGA